MTKLAQLIGRMEGYGIPGAIPTLRNNPGDLRHSPHSAHPANDSDAIGNIASPAAGWADLERQLALYGERGLTLGQMVDIFAPASENDANGYLRFLCAGLGVFANTPVRDCLAIPA